MGHRLSLLIPTLICAAGTAAAQVEDASQVEDAATGNEPPGWLQEQMQREAPRLKFRKVRFGDLRSRLPGEISIGPAYSEYWSIGTDIGGDYPVVCFVHDSELVLANTVVAQAAFDVNSVSEEMGEAVSQRTLQRIDAGAIDGSPYLGLEYLYHVGADKDASIGLIKVWAATRDGATLVCKHNEIGFRDSVFRLFQGFVRDFDSRNDSPRPYYQETFVTTADGEPRGVMKVRFTNEGGYTKVQTDQSTLRADGDEPVSATDHYSLMWSTPDGELVNAYSNSTTNGDTDHSLTLVYDEDAWQLNGTLEGVELDETLDTDTRPLTWLGVYRRIRAAMAGEAAGATTFRVWAPATAADTLAQAAFARNSETAGVLETGPVSTRIVVDNNGYLREATTAGGAAELVFTRVWRAGKLD